MKKGHCGQQNVAVDKMTPHRYPLEGEGEVGRGFYKISLKKDNNKRFTMIIFPSISGKGSPSP